MSYQVLYRTYRPTKFSEVVGQDYIVKTLLNSIKNNKIAHAYLFAGPRGTGKTTVAKLFAKAINCSKFNKEACDKCDNCKAYLQANHPDIIEMDAASNNGVDEIREIIDQIPYAPLIGKYKVYIIDEVHMLSTSAFNALLKTLEEPPAHVIFILATTDPQKVIPTVLSRCQRYNFSKITTFEIKNRLTEVLKNEGIKFDEKVIDEISRMAEGGMRDALSLLEQCLAYNPKELKISDIEKIYGLSSVENEVELYLKVHQNKISDVIQNVRQMYIKGIDIKRLATDMLEIIKDTLIYSDKANKNLLNKITPVEAQQILSSISTNELFDDVKILEESLLIEKQKQNFITYFELCLIKMANSNKKPIEQKEKIIEKEKATPVKEKTKQKEPEEKQKQSTSALDKNFLLKILLDANKDLKISDQIIYNKLDLYKYETEKRKFYQMLIGTELFACNKDAIIIIASDIQKENINSKKENKELYEFINEEYGIDKMIYAISEDEKKELIEEYKKQPKENRNKPVYVEKYTIEKKENNQENTISDLFGGKINIED